MNLFPQPEVTITHTAEQLRQGKLTAVALLNRCLQNIDDREPKVQAWVQVDRDSALAQATALDEELQAGKIRGPLHGIPIGIKDIIDVAGYPTAAGARWREDALLEQDAPLVAALRAAGAVILGKTVTTQFAFFDPPKTTNPWNINHTPGGSSSGSAAAVASDMCLGAIGSQTGGSITRPASFCGVCGCKPTFGQIDCTGVFPISNKLDHPGPFARSVNDLWLIYSVLRGNSNPANLSTIENITCGHLQLNQSIEPEMEQALANALEQISKAGGTVNHPPLPDDFAEMYEHHLVIMKVDAANYHRSDFEEHRADYFPGMTSIIEEGRQISSDRYQAALAHQTEFKQNILQCFENCDVLITPAALGAAPDRTTTGNHCMNAPWSYTGLPTVTVPMQLNSKGLPLGMQLIGKPNSENDLFAAALRVETILRTHYLG